MTNTIDDTFDAMGSSIRLLIGGPLLPGAAAPPAAADREKAFVLDYSDRLSRFRPSSELSALNRDPRERVPASPLLRAAIRSAIWAAERSDGLVDPTLVHALERNGYDHSLHTARPAPLAEALAAAPPRRPAAPDPRGRWRTVIVDDDAEVIIRPPGLALDTGGSGKGLCADAIVLHLRSYTHCAADCGGDIAVGGIGAQLAPYAIEVEHPLTGTSVGAIAVGAGGIATSGLNVRIWRRGDGSFAHHLLDPSTGEPVWSGLVGATALGASALEAETLSKMALLLGPAGARETLRERGGVIVHDSGEVEAVGPVGGVSSGGAGGAGGASGSVLRAVSRSGDLRPARQGLLR
ncbi:MAG TPA: FAD:protein FMN transferase [Solirubrobacteraceae bacterium]|nr:FAD:protein FMN transferase [Solirubrobacteraceae bacterium]